MRKLQRRQLLIAAQAVCHLAVCPVAQLGALRIEIRRQFLCAVELAQRVFGLARYVVIHQRSVDLAQLALLRQQRRIHLGLRPVQKAMILRHAIQQALEGFDLLQLVKLRVIAIRPPPHEDILVLARQRNLCLVAGMAIRRDRGMPHHALQRGRRRRKTLIQITTPGHQIAHGTH